MPAERADRSSGRGCDARSRLLALCLVVIVATLLGSCSWQREAGTKLIEGAGDGQFTFTGRAPLPDRPLRVWYRAPRGDLSRARILIVLSGTGRNAKDYRSDWEPLVGDRNVLVLVPEFSEEQFPGVSSYNLGNMVDDSGRPLPQDRWAFGLVESLFDDVVRDVGSDQKDFAMFGHSAGAQFVSRFIEFFPNNRARVAVAANAGWYTMLNDAVPFPFGTKASPLPHSRREEALRSNFVVLLGADDIDPKAQNLRRDKDADAQGITRLDRGIAFYRQAREVARQQSLPFNWTLVVQPGIAHSHTDMARAAAPWLLGVPPVQS